MDIPMILVSTLVVAAVFVPIVLFMLSGNTRQKKLIKEFKLTAVNNQLNITEFENWGEKVIGLDPVAKKLLYVRETDGKYETEVVDLFQIKKCDPVINYKITDLKNPKDRSLDVAFLSFISKNTGSQPKNLYFYDQDTVVMPDYEERRLEKWQKAIVSAL